MSTVRRLDQTRAAEFGLSQLFLIFEHPTERQYKGTLLNGQTRFVLFRKYTDEADRARAQKCAKDHEQAGDLATIQLYDWKEFENEDSSIDICFVMSSYRANILDDSVNRAKQNNPYKEWFLVSQLFKLVAVLAEMQKRNIVHRNISPLSVYMTNTGVKLGEMGQPTKEVSEARLGSERFFLSPIKRQMEHSSKWLISNPYKSDVFSLGVCMLTMVLLRKPDFKNLDNLRASIDSEIRKCKVSEEFREILKSMMVYEEQSRMDFVQLEEQCARIRDNCKMTPPPVVPVEPSQSDIDRLSLTIHPRRPLNEEEKKKPEPLALQVAKKPDARPTLLTDVRCMFCSSCKIIDSASPATFERPVHLYCDPEHHVFCSRKCFTKFAQLGTFQWKKSLQILRCRECHSPIDVFQSIEALGGPDQYEQLKRSPLKIECVYCKIENGTETMGCGHVYCIECLKMVAVLPGEFEPCKECSAPLEKSDIKKRLPSLLGRVFGLFG